MSEIQRGRDRIHGAHKDDPQWREYVKLYLDGEKRGPFEPWMVEVLSMFANVAENHRDAVMFKSSSRDLRKIAAALSSLWMEGDDNG